MARKRQKNLRLDEGIVTEYEKICDRKKENHNTVMEELMKQYIARDGQMLFDDLYAPRIAHSVKTAIDEQINRLAKMIYKTQVDATASLYSTPVFHSQQIKAMEDVLDMFINPQLLNKDRIRISDQYSLANNGKTSIKNLRKIALSDHQEQKAEKKKNEN